MHVTPYRSVRRRFVYKQVDIGVRWNVVWYWHHLMTVGPILIEFLAIVG